MIMRTRGAGGGSLRWTGVAAGATAVRRLRRPHNLRYVQVPACVRECRLRRPRTREGAACGRVLEPLTS